MGLDCVGVGEVAVELRADVIGIDIPEGGVDGAVEAVRETVAHRPLLRLDLAADLGGGWVVRESRHPAQEVVRRLLHVLVGERVHDQLAWGVGLCRGEHGEAFAGQGPDGVLDRRGLRVVVSEALGNKARVAFGLDQMIGESRSDLLVLGELGRCPQLGERLLLDGMRVSQILDQLLLGCVWSHEALLTRLSRG